MDDLNIIASKITRMNLDLYFFRKELEKLAKEIHEQECRIFDLKITIEMKRGEFSTV